MIAKKINENGRLHLDAFEDINRIDNYLSYKIDEIGLDKSTDAIKYDQKYYERIKNYLQGNTYFEKIENNSKVYNEEPIIFEPFNIDRVLEIYKKYNVRFQIVIKDNFCRINIFVWSHKFERCRTLDEIEKTIEEIMKFVDEFFD